MKQVDLHVHSSYSDGILKPAELVAMAAGKGLAAIALADHDAVDGIDEALMAGRKYCIEILPAVELSVKFKSHKDVHLLGYLIDHHDSDFLDKLALFRQTRDQRGQAIIANINARLSGENRSTICYEDAAGLAEGAFGRPHIARVLMEKGYAHDMQDAFERYLVPCDVPKHYFPIEEALAEIRRIGGISVLAHPTSITDDRKELTSLVGALATMGLQGLEAYNNVCNGDDSVFLERLARDLGLLITGGSDFHGIEEGVHMGSGRGNLSIPYECVAALRLAQQQCSK